MFKGKKYGQLSGNDIWKRLIDQLKNVNDAKGAYSTIFYAQLELFREASKCYSNKCYAAVPMICRGVIDRAIFNVYTTIILPDTSTFICKDCDKKIIGFQELNNHILRLHKKSYQYWQEIWKFIESKNISENPKDYRDEWEDHYNKKKGITEKGLKSVSIDCCLLTKKEANPVEKEIRSMGHIRLHPQREARERIKLFRSSNAMSKKWINAFIGLDIPSKEGTHKLLYATSFFFEKIIKNYYKKKMPGSIYSLFGSGY